MNSAIREVTVEDRSWQVDETGELPTPLRRLESSDPVEAALVDYGYARL